MGLKKIERHLKKICQENNNYHYSISKRFDSYLIEFIKYDKYVFWASEVKNVTDIDKIIKLN